MSNWFQANDIRKAYHMGVSSLDVLKGATLGVRKGEFVSIVGASGSGKSTLLHLLGLLDQPDKGTVTLGGQNLTALGRREHDRHRNETFGFVFQFYHLLPELNTLENVLMPHMIRHGYFAWKRVRRQLRKQAREVLDRVGIGERAKHRPNQLSGGELQRAAIARALVHQPQILLADEPTGNLDVRTGGGILDLLEQLHTQEKLTIIMVTHDPQIAQRADRCLELVAGRVATHEPVKTD